jgi:putative ABC transport system ATP-binding protein
MKLETPVRPPQPAAVTAPVVAHGLCKRYGARNRLVVDRVELRVEAGEWLAIMGPSGCGKSTLLQLLGGLITPDAGAVRVAGNDIANASESQRARIRRRHVGYVFQQYNLIDELTVLEDVSLPLRLSGMSARRARNQAADALGRFGLEERRHARPAELSGGEQQRVAIARALIARPAVVLADEPTGALDSSASATVIDLLGEARDRGQTIVMVTHDVVVASAADRALHMLDGILRSGVPMPVGQER